jgi:hypothetical protein
MLDHLVQQTPSSMAGSTSGVAMTGLQAEIK